MSEPPRDGPSPETEADPYRPAALLRTVVAQGTFIAALLFYLGAMYMSTFYGYFHISLSTLDLGFSELVTQSLRLLKLEVLVAVGLIVLVVSVPWARTRAQGYGGVESRAAARAEAVAAALSVPVVVIGVALLALWKEIQPYGWTAPLLIAVGLLMGQCRDVRGRRPKGLRCKALPVFTAVAFLFWTLTQATIQTAQRDARSRAGHVTDWTGVMVLSSYPLSLPTGTVTREVLASGLRHRYRYTGLRLLLDRDGRYYVVPLGWNADRDAIYIIQESDAVWIGLTPGTRPQPLGQ
ncbi:hypothetical protein ABZY44_13025 [Streptomyces sp. NPDC006544]|uniref:hypothetical protein n=1 Tax=Streptomyces sp. NPDC006544 TaxID=3154583 RepID=UPI0033BDC976